LREQYPHEPDWRTIPAVVRDADEDRSFLMLLSSQLHSRNWKPREEASALERLVQAGLTVTQVGETLHRTQEWASKRLRAYADSRRRGARPAQTQPAHRSAGEDRRQASPADD